MTYLVYIFYLAIAGSSSTPNNVSYRDAPRSDANVDSITRSGRRMMPLRSQVGFGAQPSHRAILPHEVDHNYGETRRPHAPQLSRHQRNVDELENQDESESLSSRLRHRTLVNSSSASSTAVPERRNTRSTRQSNDSDSEEDNTPLNRLQSGTTRSRAASTRLPANTEYSPSHRSTRQTRPAPSEEEHDEVWFHNFFFNLSLILIYILLKGTWSIESQYTTTKTATLQ